MKLKSIDALKSDYLKGKKITLCLTGSVAVVRVPEVARELRRLGAEVTPVISEAAAKFIGNDLMEWASNNPVYNLTGKAEHIEYGAGSDLVLVCPATTNTISKIAMGISDNAITTLVCSAIGARVPVIMAPAAHDSLLENPIVRQNLETLRQQGVVLVKTRHEESEEKVADKELIIDEVTSALNRRDYTGVRIVVNAGPTFERIDDVRGITNSSSGRMGIEIAKNAAARGAEVTLVYGPGKLKPPRMIKVIRVKSASDMTRETLKELESADILISAAAIGDFKPVIHTEGKIDSEDEVSLTLKPTKKMIRLAKEKFPDKFIVGFKLEAVNHKERAMEKLKKDNLDMIVANDINAINNKKNEVIILAKDGSVVVTDKATKTRTARRILDVIREKYAG